MWDEMHRNFGEQTLIGYFLLHKSPSILWATMPLYYSATHNPYTGRLWLAKALTLVYHSGLASGSHLSTDGSIMASSANTKVPEHHFQVLEIVWPDFSLTLKSNKWWHGNCKSTYLNHLEASKVKSLVSPSHKLNQTHNSWYNFDIRWDWSCKYMMEM